MTITGRTLLGALLTVIAVAGLVLWLEPQARWLALLAAGCAVAGLLLLYVFSARRSAAGDAQREPAEMDAVSQQQRSEMIRGTSLHLREMRYRYSVRIDRSSRQETDVFTAEVNTIRLGFIPVVILDNTNDLESPGFVAMVYDGRRWRGPGLPCPSPASAAIRHAAQCVSPLDEDEDEDENDADGYNNGGSNGGGRGRNGS